MTVKKVIFVTIVFAFFVALVGCAGKTKKVPLDGPPGGPIIVVQPDLESPLPTNAGEKSTTPNRCLKSPCWYAGWPDSNHWRGLPDVVKDVGVEDPPRIPFFWNHDARVEKISVTEKSGTTHDASKLELTIDSKVLVIDMGKHSEPPTWTFGGEVLSGKPFRPRRNWPRALLGTVTTVRVTELGQNQLPIDFDFNDLIEIRIVYNQ